METINTAEALRRAQDLLTSQSELRALAVRPERAVRLAIIRNPNCPADLRVEVRRMINPVIDFTDAATRARLQKTQQRNLFD